MTLRIGSYTVLDELGRGSFGVVYLARRAGLQARCALKVSTDLHQEGRERFDLEARIASKLQHPGIVPVIDAGIDQGRAYYAMPYCPGISLAARIKQGPLREAEAVWLVGQLADAVDYAHQQGVLHRDIKPGNVLLVEPDGAPRLTDFGLARDPSLRTSLTRTGTILGSPIYMAPEQWLARKDVDARADVYSLGVVLYACLTGSAPFSSTSLAALSDEVLAGAPPIEQHLPGVSPALASVVRRAMAVSREDRYPSAGALADALARALVVPDEPAADRARRPAQRGVTIAVLLVSAACVAAAGWIAVSARPRPAESPPAVPSQVAPPPVESPPLERAELEPRVPTEPSETPAVELASDPTGASLVGRDAPRVVVAIDRVGEETLPPERVRELDWLLALPMHIDDAIRDRTAWSLLQTQLEVAREEHPVDPRLDGWARCMDLAGGADALAMRRELLHAEPTPQIVGVAARISGALGFERAAIDQAIRGCLRFDWHAAPGLAAMHMLLYPVGARHDPQAAIAVGERVLAGLERDGTTAVARANPPGWDVLINLAICQLRVGDVEAALERARQSARLQPQLVGLVRALERLQRERRDPRDPAISDRFLKQIVCYFGLGAQLSALSLGDRAARTLTPERHLAYADALVDGQTTDAWRAVALVRVARYHRLAGDLGAARAALERAEGCPLGPEHADVRRLVARRLAAALLELGDRATLARAEALAHEATRVDAWATNGELADAWALVARARLTSGRVDDAAAALDEADALRPWDRRELERLRRELARSRR